MITTKEAASRLDVSQRRIQDLVKNGILEGKKIAGVWMVDEESVERRLRNVSKTGGRPARGKGRYETAFTLMNRTHEVTNLIYNTSQKRFSYIDAKVNLCRAPLGLANSHGTIPLEIFNAWWRGRGIPDARQGLASLLEESGVSLPQELLQRNLGLSLSDQYWIRPANSGLRWENVNFFNNDFYQVSQTIEPYVVEGKTAAAKPDNTSDGNLRKTWICRGGTHMLLKGGSHNNQEPFNEVVATALHRRLLNPSEYVSYTLKGEEDTAMSCCANFLTDQEEFIPAQYVERCLPDNPAEDNFAHYLNCCQSLGVKNAQQALDRMIICDDLLANHDRHYRNFGIVRNVETLECRAAPIFDSGSSLWCDVSFEALAGGEHSFTSKQFFPSPAKQMLLVSDMSWFDGKSLNGFAEEAAEILSSNDALTKRLPFLRKAIEWRINRMINIAEWD